MSDSYWRDPEYRADPPLARDERQWPAGPADDTFAGLYRAPAGCAVSDGAVQKLPDRSAGDVGPGGYRRGDARAGGDGALTAGLGGDRAWRLHRWGMFPGRFGVLVMTVSAAVGAFATIVAGTEPGTVLGVILVAGSLAGVSVVHPRAAYRLVPVPAIAGFAALLLAGVVHDRAVDTSHTVLALNALGWMAGGFAAMAVATVATLVAAVVRYIWYNRSQRVSDRSFTDAPWDGPR